MVATDLNLNSATIAKLTSADALAAFFTSLGYRTDVRKPMSAEAIGLAGDAAAPIRAIELLAEDDDGFMRVVLVHLRSLTAKSHTDLSRVLVCTNVDHLLVLTSDFSSLEFVLLDKRRRESRGPAGVSKWRLPGYVALFEWSHNLKSAADAFLRSLLRSTVYAS